MELQGYFTSKGLALAAKLASGAALKITRVTAGSGKTGNPAAATALPQPRQQLAVNPPLRRENTAILPVTLTAALASAAYDLTELGVFAQDPNEGEILYKLYKLPSAMKIDPTSCLVLRFYLEETVSQDLGVTVACSPAGLITEADFAPVRDKVELAEVPSRRVTLAASELQACIDALPRLVAEHLELSVTGELNTKVELRNFYGPGSISIVGSKGFTLRNSLIVSHCRLRVTLHSIDFQEREGMTVNDGLVFAEYCTAVTYVSRCSFTGLGGASKVSGAHAEFGSRIMLSSDKGKGLCNAVSSFTGSSVAVYGEESDYQDNATGAWSRLGGIVALGNDVLETLGGSANRKNGGLIVKSDGTLL